MNNEFNKFNNKKSKIKKIFIIIFFQLISSMCPSSNSPQGAKELSYVFGDSFSKLELKVSSPLSHQYSEAIEMKQFGDACQNY